MLYYCEIENISPVQYYTIQSSHGMLTGPFIGDIALDYATAYYYGDINYHNINIKKPDYSEIKKFHTLWSIAVPSNLILNNNFSLEYMKMFIRNTMHGIDYNGTNVSPDYPRVGSNMYKNFFFVQPIKPGNLFYAAVKTDLKINELPESLRIGNNKTGIIKIKYNEIKNNNIYINLFTIKKIFNKNIEAKNIYYFINNYIIVGPVSADDFDEIYRI